MRFRMECVLCGNSTISPEGRDPGKLEELLECVDEMGLRCRKCDGPVAVRIEPDVEGQ